EDLTTRAQVDRRLLSQATLVADRLTRSERRARQVFIKIRDANFLTVTRQRTLEHPTAEASTIYEAATSLFDSLDWESFAVRLTGVGVAGLRRDGEETQLDLFGDHSMEGIERGAGDRARRRAVQETMTAVRTRFGAEKLTPGGGRDGIPETGGRAVSRNRRDED
ncbi:MAG: hypothetical protein ACPHRO_11765, partial [Nannocystaceae bacterium]